MLFLLSELKTNLSLRSEIIVGALTALDGILGYAEKISADLIITGRRGDGGVTSCTDCWTSLHANKDSSRRNRVTWIHCRLHASLMPLECRASGGTNG
jgi:hypothetical protein